MIFLRMMGEPEGGAAAFLRTVNERIDPSVFRRCHIDPDYRPDSLLEWARRKKLNLQEIIDAPEKSAYTAPILNPGILVL